MERLWLVEDIIFHIGTYISSKYYDNFKKAYTPDKIKERILKFERDQYITKLTLELRQAFEKIRKTRVINFVTNLSAKRQFGGRCPNIKLRIQGEYYSTGKKVAQNIIEKEMEIYRKNGCNMEWSMKYVGWLESIDKFDFSILFFTMKETKYILSHDIIYIDV